MDVARKRVMMDVDVTARAEGKAEVVRRVRAWISQYLLDHEDIGQHTKGLLLLALLDEIEAEKAP